MRDELAPLHPAAPDSRLPADCPAPFRTLLEGIERGGIRYCHWKSNVRLAESLRGAEDLDLLVDRTQAGAFFQILLRAGFKPARSACGIGHPGVFHAFALDEVAGRLLHLHAYFQVVTGDSIVKSFRLPIDADLIDDARRQLGVPVPSAEAELALFALRMALKHTSVLEIAMVSRGYSAVVDELDVLDAAADRTAAAALWCRWLPGATPGSLDRTLSAISDPRAIGRRIAAGRRTAAGLRGVRRLGRAAAFAERWRRMAAAVVLRLLRRRDLRPVSGGAIIALVGPKATGKSTLGGEIARCLGKHLDVRRVHVGKPPATVLTLMPLLALPLARALFPGERTGEYEKPARRETRSFSWLYVARMAMLAHERRALLRRCARAAAAGVIVVTDRYPSKTVGAIDSSCFSDADIAACASRLKGWLMRHERALYENLPQPDLVIRLEAPPAVAVARDERRNKEGGPDAGAVLRRWGLETLGSFGDVPVAEVDTGAPLERTVALVVRKAWAAI